MAIFASFIVCSAAMALPSLDAQHWRTIQVDEKIGNSTEETMLTVIQDSNKPLVFYYVPNRPRLAETITKKDGKRVVKPVFQMMTLQTKSAKTKNFYEEGLLQFALRMDLQPESASQAAKLIFEDLQKNGLATETSDIKLLPLPVSSASISIYKPSGEWLSSGIQQPSIAPIFSTQAVPFQINLTNMGADAMKALTQKGQAGLGIYYELSFEGILPPAKLTVELDWKQTFKHFSENTKTKKYWNALLFAGGTSRTDTKNIAEELLENKCIKVKMECRGDKLEALQKVLDPILERINNELIEKMAPPEKVNPAEAEEPSYGIGMFYGGGSSYAMKKHASEKKGTETFTFERAQIVTRATSCGTFIGIGNYDKEIIEAANIVMEPGNWEKAYYVLPTVGAVPGLMSVTINQYVQYKEGSGKAAGSYPTFSGVETPQLVMCNPSTSDNKTVWTNKSGEVVTNISWPLQALYAEAKAANKEVNDYVEYKVDMIITSKGKSGLTDELKMSELLPMMAGDKPVSSPLSSVDTITVDGSYLNFDVKKGGLKRVNIDIERQSSDGKKVDKYSWIFDGKSVVKEPSHSWFIPKQGDFQYIPKVIFYPAQKASNGKMMVEWQYNGKDLFADDGYGNYIDPTDNDWQ
jgi:hypothetical protein